MTAKLTTSYLGLNLRNPLVLAASPITGRFDALEAAEQAGAAAVVLPSLFQEQIEHEAKELLWLRNFDAKDYPEPLGYFPDMLGYNAGPREYIRLLEEAKRRLKVPVMASLNGTALGGWTRYARVMEDAGADALELNVYFVPTDPEETGREVEDRYLQLVSSIRETVRLPLAVKVGPSFSAPANMAKRLVEAGADGLVLFNRCFLPDVDLRTLSPMPTVPLTHPHEIRLELRWVSIFRSQLDVDLAASGGAHGPDDVVKLIAAGADVVQLASAVIQKGPEHIAAMLQGLKEWLDAHHYDELGRLRGSLRQDPTQDRAAAERGNYVQTLTRYASKVTGK